jgi:hypothetical protein
VYPAWNALPLHALMAVACIYDEMEKLSKQQPSLQITNVAHAERCVRTMFRIVASVSNVLYALEASRKGLLL